MIFRIELEAFVPPFSYLQECVLLCHPYHASQALSKYRRCSQNHSCDEELCAHEHEEQSGPLQLRFEPKSSTSLSLGIIRELSWSQLRFADSWPRHVISPFLCEKFTKKFAKMRPVPMKSQFYSFLDFLSSLKKIRDFFLRQIFKKRRNSNR